MFNWKKIGAFVLLLAIVATLSVVVSFFTKVNKATSNESRPTTFVVEKGSTTKQIANRLADAKIIGRAWVFNWYVWYKGAGSKIQAGEYLLDPNMSVAQIVEVLTGGRVVPSEKKITIIEGLTNKQVGQKVGDPDFENKLKLGDFSDFKFNNLAIQFNYQGFLFPDTYTIGKNSTTEDLIAKMLNNFERKLDAKMLADIEAKKTDLGKILTMASIIEKEVGRNKEKITDQDLAAMQMERELVASVFYNRLEIGMALESDATVNYVTGKADRQALIEDTKIKSPYNTYQVRGLPPGPISNPGLSAIKAAINPAESDYLFFLNARDGTAYFAQTLAEHNANRAKYLE